MIDTTRMPSLQELNNATCCQVGLLLLRCLVSSDGMTRMYELFQLDTLRDVIKQTNGLLDTAGGVDGDHGLTHKELTEYDALQASIVAYMQNRAGD